MKIIESAGFKKQLAKLPFPIRKKYQNKIILLAENFFHPSLHTKKKKGIKNRWEARIDYHYRFTFIKEKNTLILLTIGVHDEGLDLP